MQSQKQYPKLSILPINKTTVFYSPIEDENVLVRTGTIPDGACFYHSVLHALSKDYVSMDEKGRKSFVSRLRKSLASRINKEKWEKLSDGLVAKIPFQENINTLITGFYQYVTKGKDRVKNYSDSLEQVIDNTLEKKEYIDTYKIILEMIPLSDFEKYILPDSYDESADKLIKDCKPIIIRNTRNHYRKIFERLKEKVDRKKREYCIDKLCDLMENVVDKAEESAFSNYIRDIKNTSVVVDTYTIGMVANRFNRDIYFIDSKTRMPYREGGTSNIKGRKSIILMWTEGVHYEIIGLLLKNNVVKREFKPDDPLIKKIRTYLCNPEKIPKEYPSLIPYLPKEARNKTEMKSKSPRGSSRSCDLQESDYSSDSSESSYSEHSDEDRSYSEEESAYSPRSSSAKRSNSSEREKEERSRGGREGRRRKNYI